MYSHSRSPTQGFDAKEDSDNEDQIEVRLLVRVLYRVENTVSVETVSWTALKQALYAFVMLDLTQRAKICVIRVLVIFKVWSSLSSV